MGKMQNPQMKLFIKSWCGWCKEAMEWLDERSYNYTKVDINQDAQARQEMVQLSQQSRVPTLVVNGEVLPDFDTDQLEIFLKKHGINS